MCVYMYAYINGCQIQNALIYTFMTFYLRNMRGFFFRILNVLQFLVSPTVAKEGHNQ